MLNYIWQGSVKPFGDDVNAFGDDVNTFGRYNFAIQREKAIVLLITNLPSGIRK